MKISDERLREMVAFVEKAEAGGSFIHAIRTEDTLALASELLSRRAAEQQEPVADGLPPGEWWMFYDHQAGKWCVYNDGPPRVVRTDAEVFHVREVRTAAYPQPLQQEPVGFAPVWKHDGTLMLSEARPTNDFPAHWANDGYEIRPFYASPPPVRAGASEEMTSLRSGVEKLVAELKRWDTFAFGGNASQQGGVGIMKTKMLDRLSALLNGGNK